MKKFISLILAAVFLLLFGSSAVYAHGGNTDSSGGHKNHSTGEYHYHHGHPAHQHEDIDGDGDRDCPYDFTDKTGQNSGSTYRSSNKSTPTATPKPTPRPTPKPETKKTASLVGPVEKTLTILFFLVCFYFLVIVPFK